MSKPPRDPFTPQEIKEIRALAGMGMRDEDIAKIKEVSESWLKKQCKQDLHEGRASGKATIQNTAFQMAKSGKFPALTIFWLKARCNWRDHDNAGYQLLDKKDKLIKSPELPLDPVEAAKVYKKFITES